MRTIVRARTAGLFVLSCLVAVPVWAAQESGSPKNPKNDTKTERAQRRQARFRGMDVNRDGVITRQEWRGNAQAFERRDINRDGVLSGTEVWPPNEATPDWQGRAGRDNVLVQSFLRTDRNRDGIVSREEWPAGASSFERVDANDDGVISEPEYLGEGWEDTTGTSGRLAPSSAAPSRQSRAYQAGYDRGLADGRQAGKEDKERRNSWDLEGQSELEQADAGYSQSLGVRPDYQAGYRAGFRVGYYQGFGPKGDR